MRSAHRTLVLAGCLSITMAAGLLTTTAGSANAAAQTSDPIVGTYTLESHGTHRITVTGGPGGYDATYDEAPAGHLSEGCRGKALFRDLVRDPRAPGAHYRGEVLDMLQGCRGRDRYKPAVLTLSPDGAKGLALVLVGSSGAWRRTAEPYDCNGAPLSIRDAFRVMAGFRKAGTLTDDQYRTLAADPCGAFRAVGVFEPHPDKQISFEKERFTSSNWRDNEYMVCGDFNWLYTIYMKWPWQPVPGPGAKDKVGYVQAEMTACIDRTYKVVFNGRIPDGMNPTDLKPTDEMRPMPTITFSNTYGWPYAMALPMGPYGLGVGAAKWVPTKVKGSGPYAAPYGGWDTSAVFSLAVGGVAVATSYGSGSGNPGGADGSVIPLGLITADTVRQHACEANPDLGFAGMCEP
jgi:hypothetical protein